MTLKGPPTPAERERCREANCAALVGASSQNARTHGLTAVPPADDVWAWYAVITGSNMGTRADTPEDAVALRLAASEVRVQRAEHYATTCDTDPNAPQQTLNRLARAVEGMLEEMGPPSLDHPADPYDLAELNYGLKLMERLHAEAERQRRLSRRYLGEARAERRRALAAWCEERLNKKCNSRNDANFHLIGET